MPCQWLTSRLVHDRRPASKLAQQLRAASIPETAELPASEAEARTVPYQAPIRSAVPRTRPPSGRSTRANSLPAHSLAAASSRMEVRDGVDWSWPGSLPELRFHALLLRIQRKRGVAASSFTLSARFGG